MAGGNFMHRVISYVLNEVVVNGLAKSVRFIAQRHLKYCLQSTWFFAMGQNNFYAQGKYGANPWVIAQMIVTICPAFQRFAVRTSRKIEDISKIAEKKKQELAEQVKEISKNMEESFKK